MKVRSGSAEKIFPVVGVGASAGGLEAFTHLLQHLPTDTGMAFVLVQHLDPKHSSALTQLLARTTTMAVSEVTDKVRVEPNHVYVIPPKVRMVIEGGRLRLHRRRMTETLHRPIDTFFESLAHDMAECAVGVVLSGMASDGTQGLEVIKGEGGITLAQDGSAKYESMPRNAIAAGCVDLILSPEMMAQELARIARHPSLQAGLASALKHGPPVRPAAEERAGTLQGRIEPGGLAQVLLRLRDHAGVDFSVYKPRMIKRRISRRMVLNKVETLNAYAATLRGNPGELDALYADMLISVTGFFRNPAAFEVLKRKVFPKWVGPRPRETARVWVVGCSTGQEAYSIGMAYAEFAEVTPGAPRLQIFATDLNERLLDQARQGFYTSSLVQDVSPERLGRFFVEESAGYRVTKSLRERVVFARHDLMCDPPFSRLDLVSCRNLMIYVDTDFQSRMLSLFHYALRPGGVLFLGSAETAEPAKDLFKPVNRKQRIFARQRGVTPSGPLLIDARLPGGKAGGGTRPGAGSGQGTVPELSAQREADRLLAKHYTPPGVLVDAQLQVVQFRGSTSPFLGPPQGHATLELMKMAKAGLRLSLRRAIQQAKTRNKPVRKAGVRLEEEGQARVVDLQVIPLTNLKGGFCLVLFEEPGPARKLAEERAVRRPPASRRVEALERQVKDLVQQLTETREHAHSVQEQYEASNEQLRVYNEEVTSGNEELQSANEELGTATEELESSNEELATINEELGHRNAELSRINADLKNLQTSINTPIVVVDLHLRIQQFTALAASVFNLLASDIGRRLGGMRHELELPDLEALLGEVIASGRSLQREVRDKAGRWYVLRARPYLTLEDKIDGAVVILMDVTELKQAEEAARQAKDALGRYASDLEGLSYSLAHDMRAPLRAIRGFLSVIEQKDAEQLSGESREYFERIQTATTRLDALIVDSLSYTKAMREDLPLQPVDVGRLLNGILQTFPNLQAAEAEIRVDCDSVVVRGNEAWLTQCFSNLLGNAVKFVHPGTKPWVHIWAERRAERVRIWVEDHGIGIPPEQQGKLFGMFQRLHAAEEYPGTGIGLALARKVVQRMGGTMGVESEPGRGSKFWVELPKGD